MTELTVIDYCFDGIEEEIDGQRDAVVSDEAEVPDDEDIGPVERSDVGELSWCV